MIAIFFFIQNLLKDQIIPFCAMGCVKEGGIKEREKMKKRRVRKIWRVLGDLFWIGMMLLCPLMILYVIWFGYPL